jgi:general secretion pathway protein D
MLRPHPLRAPRLSLRVALAATMLIAPTAFSQAPNPANSPASIPAGLLPAPPPTPAPEPKPTTPISAKQLHEADDAYLDGARQLDHKNLAAAERSFERAVQLDHNNRDYALALIVARENRVTELVQTAARARLHGDIAQADALLNQARTLDPDNRVVAQHFNTPPPPAPPAFNPGLLYTHADPSNFPAAGIASTLAGPVEFAPSPATRDVHIHAPPQAAVRDLYSLFGIATVFDPSVNNGPNIDMDLTQATFADATRILNMAAHVFAVPIQPKVALIAKDTQETRDQFIPQVEETIYLPGLTNDEMQELATLARNVFDVSHVATSATGGYMLLRGDENVLRQVNATYDDMLDGGSEVLFDVNLYEIDKTRARDIGAKLPNSLQAFPIIATATNLINANQSIIQEAIQNGLLTLTGNPAIDELAELGILIAAGVSGTSELTSLLGTVGNFDGLPLAGVSVGSSGSFALLLNSSDTRLLDAVQIRSSNKTPVNFRAGSRYPIVTAQYSSGIGNSLPASLSGLSINGTSVKSLLSQYLGASSVSVPQFQFEDLGITLKMTPRIQHNTQVSVALEMKIEALAGGSINSIPILNNRSLISTITIPIGQTAMLATLVSTNEIKSLTGLPGLSELPGFQGTEQDREKDSTELLITITPHLVRAGRLNVASRRLSTGRASTAAQ